MKMILDLDTGIDDALALTYALGLTDTALIGVTTVFGNVTIDKAVKNTLNILELLGREDIPVFEGAASPAAADSYQTSALLHQVHGKNGIGNVELGEPKNKKSKTSAVEFIINSAQKFAEDLTLVATGPLTNLAEAIKKDPDAVRKIGKIVIMGGALTVPGNTSIFAEANIHNDPDAAKYVFESGIPLILVGLDVTLKTMITKADIVPWTSLDTKAGQAITALTTYYYKNEYRDSNIGGAMHDPLAVEVAVNPDIVTNAIPVNLTVETDGASAGRTIGSLDRLNQKDKNTLVCVDVDSETFINKFTKTMHAVLSGAN